jgi:hypothetical protein
MPNHHALAERFGVFGRFYVAEGRAGRFSTTGNMPMLQVIRPPNDHTSASGGSHSPRAQVADNNLALGRIFEALTRSPFNTMDVLATIERILHLGSLSQFDRFGRPISEPFGGVLDLRPHRTSRPAVDLEERNPFFGGDTRESVYLDLRLEGLADEELFNRVLWLMVKCDARPYPPARRVATLEFARAR